MPPYFEYFMQRMPDKLSQLIKTDLADLQRIAWFGLSADPPTLSHRSMVDAVLGSGLVDGVVVFPAGNLPYKTFEATDWQRWDMLELWKAEALFGDEVILSRFDILREEAYTWIQLWQSLQQLAPKKQHLLVLGSDQFKEIPLSWDQGDKLLDQASFLIVPREGYPLEETGEHQLLQIAPLAGSSTAVRKGELRFVDDKVKRYISEQQLYKPS